MRETRAGGGNSFIIRLEMDTRRIDFGQVITAMAKTGGDLVAIDVIQTRGHTTTRDLTVQTKDASQIEAIVQVVKRLEGVSMIHVSDRTFLLHLGGKIEISPKKPIHNRDDLSRVYTPEVARVCLAIHEEPNKVHALTIKRNTVAVVSDGSAVLGLGNIGPNAALPVMEGKAMLFKQLANVDAFPLCLDTSHTEEIIDTIVNIAPAFGGINLEDIASPHCFEIERQLQQRLNIPVFHDDQHGTAVVIYASLINALKVVGKRIDEVKIVVCGIGAAGIASTKILLHAGAKHLIGVDQAGIISVQDHYDNPMWQWYAEHTNPHNVTGGLREAIADADVFIGLSTGGVLKREDVLCMADQPIIFAMANPEPEIDLAAVEDIVAVYATGRSDYPNQINNVLCFPGIFRAALDCRATTINEAMKLAAAEAIASVVRDDEVNKSYIIPSVFNPDVVERIRDKVIRAAIQTGVAQRIPREYK